MTKLDAVSKELRSLWKSKRLFAENVVESARDPDSPLHGCFEWDDSKAAAEYRLIEARKLIARVKIVFERKSGDKVIVRAYHSIRSERNGYQHTNVILGDADLRQSLLSQMVDDLNRIKERYEVLRDFSKTKALFTAIEEFCGIAKAETV